MPSSSTTATTSSSSSLSSCFTPFSAALHPSLIPLLAPPSTDSSSTTGSTTNDAAAAKAAADSLLQETTDLLRKLIQTACVNNGDGTAEEIKNIEVLKTFLDSYSLPYQVYAHPDRPKRPSLIAEYYSGAPGRSKSPRVMLGPGHVDVVPVSEKDWDVPPFEGRLVDGELYGRGAVDMLPWVAAQAVVFARLAKAKVPLEGTLVFCAVSDEEAGGKEGVGYLLQDPTLKEVFRADYVMTEFGGATLTDMYNQPTTTYIHANGEKGSAVVEVVCKGTPGHGSVPKNGDNALAKAAGVIDCLAQHWTPTVITPEWSSLVWAMDTPWIVRFLLSNAWTAGVIIRLLLFLGHAFGPGAHALTRLTLSPNHVKGTLSYNVIPGTVIVEVDARVLPGQDEAYIIGQIERALGRKRMKSGDFDIRMKTFFPATISSIDAPLWQAMKQAGQDLVPGCSFVHPLLTGATDSRYYRRYCGTVAYGTNLFHPSFSIGKLMAMIHGNNERIGLESLLLSVQYFALTVVHMMGGMGKKGELIKR